MRARNPEDLHRLFATALNAGDLDGLMSLYAPDAALVPQPRQAAVGKAAIREALAGFLVMKPVFTLTTRGIVKTADLALLSLELSGHARREPGGRFRLARGG